MRVDHRWRLDSNNQELMLHAGIAYGATVALSALSVFIWWCLLNDCSCKITYRLSPLMQLLVVVSAPVPILLLYYCFTAKPVPVPHVLSPVITYSPLSPKYLLIRVE